MSGWRRPAVHSACSTAHARRGCSMRGTLCIANANALSAYEGLRRDDVTVWR